MSETVAIVSGGLDSVTLLHWMVKVRQMKPVVITYKYGQRHEREIEYARYHADLLGLKHVVLDMTALSTVFSSSALVTRSLDVPSAQAIHNDPQPATYVPNRNMTFISLAAAYAESVGRREVYFGAQRADMNDYWDMTEDFLEAMNTVLRLSRRRHIVVDAPFIKYTKADLIEMGNALGVDFAKTWSCYLGGEIACGECPSCAERLHAFRVVGIQDPIPYRVKP